MSQPSQSNFQNKLRTQGGWSIKSYSELKKTQMNRGQWFAKKNGIVFLVFFSLIGCAYAQQSEGDTRLPAHHAKEGFQNPYVEKKHRGLFRYLKMRYFSDEKFADYKTNAHKVPIEKQLDLARIHNPSGGVQITWIGHATILIQYKGINILTDPMFSNRASPVGFAGPKRYNPPGIQLNRLPKLDYVVISHSHYDHLDLNSVRQIGSQAQWLVPLGLKAWFGKAGIDPTRVLELDWWQEVKFGAVTITSTPAQHWSSRGLWDRNKSLWTSWMLQIDDRKIWYSGDTGYNPYQFKEIQKKFKEVDLALISIGAYEPRWFMKDMHINPDEAVQIHLDLNSKYSIGIQWGTFQLTSEPIDDPPLKLKAALTKRKIPLDAFEVMKIGETRVIYHGNFKALD